MKHLFLAVALLWITPDVLVCAAPRRQVAHPAVVRVIASERGGTSYGSGTLVGIGQSHGLVITNWHVVRDATGPIIVVFPDGFQSAAAVMKVDRDWDLAALAIWRPNVRPVALATAAPRPGETLTIAGYGPGWFRAVSGNCTQYVAPGSNMPFEMVELTADARNGDSGGPILNRRGELAGVLFGAAFGRTTGSYCGRVRWFLASVRDDFDSLQPPPSVPSEPQMIAQHGRPDPSQFGQPQQHSGAPITAIRAHSTVPTSTGRQAVKGPAVEEPFDDFSRPVPEEIVAVDPPATGDPAAMPATTVPTRAEQIKTILAAIGILAVLFHGLRLLGAAQRA